MSFATRLKEEIVNNSVSRIVLESELSAIVRYNAVISKDKIVMTFENGAIARRVYKSLKDIFEIPVQIIIRNQKKLRSKQIYILEIHDKVLEVLNLLKVYKHNRLQSVNNLYLEDPEEIMGFVRGIFLAHGSISDPATSGYHLEFVFNAKTDADFLNKLLKKMKFHSKISKRQNKYMVYLKASEEISDMIRLFEASNSLFYFEDIRIYRDHKNMLNRLNNCDIANQEKTVKAGNEQLANIEFLEQHNLFNLLDEKTMLVALARKKYPECSYQELADIISSEYNYQIGKSGINHHFIKIKKLILNYKSK